MPNSNESQARNPIVPLAKAEGAFLALAAGDALGWPQEMPRNILGNRGNAGAHVEFEEWRRRGGGRFHPFEEVIHSGEYSDDTQLTLAVARSRIHHCPAWWKAFTRIELPLWTLYERGGGGATKRAANAWAGGSPPWKSSKRGHALQDVLPTVAHPVGVCWRIEIQGNRERTRYRSESGYGLAETRRTGRIHRTSFEAFSLVQIAAPNPVVFPG